MKLSVIIVNYNVRAYLDQCLRAVLEAMKGIGGEVFVVDNLSTDGSVELVRDSYPGVKLIANVENVGFSRANNQAIRLAQGEYVLLLNPDTVVGEDVFDKVIAFMDTHQKAGGLGVKMVDGTGRFLPESKRGLPTPSVAFYKIIGLARMFPRSRVFGRYHLGHLAEDDTARIEILSGACMFLRKKTLDQVGLLDESFFMYGEDIDLSYRITLGGYDNYYFPEARILHYKGESTKKSSVNYVFVFYNAMAIFAQKHFTRKGPDLFAWLIRGAIYLSAAGAIVMRFLRRALLPLLDVAGLAICLLLSRDLVDPGLTVPLRTAMIALPLLLVFCNGIIGAYDRPVRPSKAFSGALLFGLLITVLLTDASMNGVSIGHLLFFAGTAALVSLLGRLVLHLLGVRSYGWRSLDRRRILTIGSLEETEHAMALLWQTHFGLGRQIHLHPKEVEGSEGLTRLRKEIRKQGIDEVVFCAKDLGWGRMVELMALLNRTGTLFKIAQPGREFIIGPSSIESLNDLMVLEAHAVNSPSARRNKRLVDLVSSVVLLITLPVNIWFVERRGPYVRNLFDVLLGRRTWVAFHHDGARSMKLPALLPGVLDPVTARGLRPDPVVVERINLTYAKDYRALEDLGLIGRGLSLLGSGT